jgi:hypothetical protein
LTASLKAGQLAAILIPGLAIACYYDWTAWHAAGSLGFPYDDAWIHAQFARNLAAGNGFSYSGGRSVAGSTAPAWTLLLALGYLAAPGMIAAAKALGILLQLGSGVVAARLALSLTGAPSAAVAAGLMVVLTPVMAWGGVGGMEVPLAVFLVLAGFHLYLRDADPTHRARLAGIAVLCLSCLARPENLVLVAIVGGHFVLGAGSVRAGAARTAQAALIAAVVIGPMIAFDYKTIGRPLPTTFYAKSGPGVVRALEERNAELARRALLTHAPAAVVKFGETLVDQFRLAAIAVPLGMVLCFAPSLRRRGAWVIALALVAAPFAMGATAPQRLKPDNVRYVGQLVCLAAVVGVAGVWLMVGNRVPKSVSTLLMAALVLGPVSRAYAQAPFYALSVKNIQQLHVATGRWACEHLPQGSTLALNDIGAIAYFSRHAVIDLEGLVTPEALSYRGPGRGLRFAEEVKPDYVAVFPSWHPDFMQAPERFEEVHRVSIIDNYIAGDSVIVVYRTPWTRQPPIRNPVPEARACRGPA